MNIKTFVLTPKQFRRHKHNNDNAWAYAFYRPAIDRHYIVRTHKISTKNRLHELGHCLKGHCKSASYNIGKPLLASEYIKQELEAEIYAFNKCSKSISVIYVLCIACEVMRHGASVSFVFNQSQKILRNNGRIFNNQERSLFWHCLIEFKRAKKPDIFEPSFL